MTMHTEAVKNRADAGALQSRGSLGAALRLYRGRWGLLCLRAGVLLCATVVAIVLAEVLVANLKPQMTWARLLQNRVKHFSLLTVFEPCDYLPFRLRAGAIGVIESSDFSQVWTINQHGRRGPERPQAKQPGEFRIVALGDSFTAGHGVEERDCWPRRLETILNKQGSRPFVVVNAAYAAGHSPDCYYAYLKRYLSSLQPDLVILGLFAGNDSYDAFDHFWPEVDEYGLPDRVLSLTRYVDATGRRRMTQAARPFVYQFPVLRDSHLWVLAVSALQSSPANRSGFHSAHKLPANASMEQAYHRSVRCVLGINRLTQQHGCRLLVLLIPTAFQVDDDVESPVKHDPAFDVDLPQRRWLADFHEAGLEVHDLRAALRQACYEHGVWKLYHRTDRHFTALGQRVTAKKISTWLKPVPD